LSNLTLLQELLLNHNQLTSLPEALLSLSNLKWLDLVKNPLNKAVSALLEKIKKKGVKIDK
jgi:Leucine-rich repeat (LRR) protein